MKVITLSYKTVLKITSWLLKMLDYESQPGCPQSRIVFLSVGGLKSAALPDMSTFALDSPLASSSLASL